MSKDCSVKCLIYYLESRKKPCCREEVEKCLNYKGDEVSLLCFEEALKMFSVSFSLFKAPSEKMVKIKNNSFFVLLKGHYVFVEKVVGGVGYMYDPSVGMVSRILNLTGELVYVFIIDE